MSSKLKKNKKRRFEKSQVLCNHVFIIDLIDISPEQSQTIKYCTKCYIIDKLY
jgi:hypothetical protein